MAALDAHHARETVPKPEAVQQASSSTSRTPTIGASKLRYDAYDPPTPAASTHSARLQGMTLRGRATSPSGFTDSVVDSSQRLSRSPRMTGAGELTSAAETPVSGKYEVTREVN